MPEDAPAPGSIADTVARILLWCRRSDHGFIRITFDDGRARAEVVNRVRSGLDVSQSFHELNLPQAATADILAERLADELARLGPGVVSITGFEATLPASGPEIAKALRALNARRENFAIPGQHTLWWFPRHIAQAISQEHHDLNSWFLKRTDLTEAVTTPEDRVLLSKWHEATRLKDAAQYQQAESLVREILANEEKHLPPNHPRIAIALNTLAQLLQDTNRLVEAEPLYRRALLIDEASYGLEHPNVAIRLNNLATLFYSTNRLAEAEPLMRRALQIDEASYGPEHPDVAIDLNNLALLLQDTNRLAEAEPLMCRALQIDEASFGAEHPKVAIRLNNLAQLLQDTNRLAEAEPLMRRALQIDEVSYGPEHPNVAIRLNNLAQLLMEKGRMPEAIPLSRRQLIIFAKFTAKTGHEHPHLPRALNNYRSLLLQSGHTEEQAQELVRSSMAEGGLPQPQAENTASSQPVS